MIWNALDILDCMRCRSEEAERFCQPCLRWVCTERCWPGDHFDKCWDCLPQRPQLKHSAVATIRWRIIARKMKRFAGVCLIHSYLRINPRRVAPLFEDDWPAGRTPPPVPWGDYIWDANIALADFDAMPQDDHFGQDTAPCSTSAPGSASAAEPSLHSMD